MTTLILDWKYPYYIVSISEEYLQETWQLGKYHGHDTGKIERLKSKIKTAVL